MSKVQELQHLSLATSYEIDDTFDSEKFIKMRLRVCHDGTNPNMSNFEVENMDKTKDSIKNIPILANVMVDEDGDPQFGGHDMELEEHKMQEGEHKLIYKEVPIGLVPESCDHKIEQFKGKNYVYCDCYIWKGYSNYAEDIIQRDKDIKLSMEILVDAYSYNAKEKIYNITDYRYLGITFLNKDYGTGMKDALATTETFEEKGTKEKFIIMMEELKDTLTTYNINNNEEGGSNVNDDILNLLNQYNVTEENLSFSVENMSIEEIEDKLKETYGVEEEVIEETVDELADEFVEEIVDENIDENKEPEKFIKSFELSHEDIRYALYSLLVTVEEEDNEWYFIDQVFDDHFEYMNWEGNKIYRQNYTKDGDNVSLGDGRIELFQERLTKEEKEALDNMRSNYSALEQEVDDLREFQAGKIAEERKELECSLFEEFQDLNGIEEYEKFKEDASKYELEELTEKCFAIRGKKNSKFSIRQTNKKDKVKIEFSKIEEKGNDEYLELFEKYLKD